MLPSTLSFRANQMVKSLEFFKGVLLLPDKLANLRYIGLGD